MNIRKIKGISLSRVIGRVIVTLWALFAVAAIGWIFVASVSTTRGIFSNELLGEGLHFENYVKVFEKFNMVRYFLNSLFYTAGGCIGVILLVAPAAYVMANYSFRGRKAMQGAYVSSMGIPGIMLMIPMFMVVSKLELAKSPILMIFIYICLVTPFTVFFLQGFFEGIPRSIQEAALIDGCSHLQAFWKIIFPMAKSGLVTVTIFNFITLWNEYMWALVFVNSGSRRTLALGLQAIVDGMRYSGDWAGLFAAVVIVFVPTLVCYIFLSEKIIGGMVSGAVKG